MDVGGCACREVGESMLRVGCTNQRTQSAPPEKVTAAVQVIPCAHRLVSRCGPSGSGGGR
jgi:hypothetical protein